MSLRVARTRRTHTTQQSFSVDLGVFFFFQAEDGIRDRDVTGVQTCALPICIILDANHATFSASRRTRKEVIGHSVCQILHGGKIGRASCRERV